MKKLFIFVLFSFFSSLSFSQDIYLSRKKARILAEDTISVIVSSSSLNSIESSSNYGQLILALKNHYDYPFQIVTVDFPENFQDSDPLPYDKDKFIQLHWNKVIDIKGKEPIISHTYYISMKGKDQTSRLGIVESINKSQPNFPELIKQLNSQIARKSDILYLP